MTRDEADALRKHIHRRAKEIGLDLGRRRLSPRQPPWACGAVLPEPCPERTNLGDGGSRAFNPYKET